MTKVYENEIGKDKDMRTENISGHRDCKPVSAGLHRLVFAHTRRFVTDEQAFDMSRVLDSRIQAVGVFVNEPLEHVAALCDRGVIMWCSCTVRSPRHMSGN